MDEQSGNKMTLDHNQCLLNMCRICSARALKQIKSKVHNRDEIYTFYGVDVLNNSHVLPKAMC